ncbi:MAG: glycosyltransferase [Propionibacteriaceae bacterium]|jgi:glycosyltransferase involved in cell wall biosynthesis|nr:glycosyltransferase [Propionibacteriaceae bacterium]
MRVGLFTDDFFPESGGIGRSLQVQLAALDAAGHEVTLFAPRTHFHAPEVGGYFKTPVWRFPGTPSHLCVTAATGGLVRRIAAKYPLDVIHTQNERGAFYLGMMLRQLLQVPQVHTFHTNFAGAHLTTPIASRFVSHLYLQGLAVKLLDRYQGDLPPIEMGENQVVNEDSPYDKRDFRSLASFAAHVTLSTSPAKHIADPIVAASGGALADRMSVIPNAVSQAFVEVKRKRERDGITRFLSVGRLDKQKRVDVILEAYAQLADDDTELLIIGDGGEFAALKRQAEKITKGRVLFTGLIGDQRRLAQEMADADAFILGSYHFDVQPMVLIEAAAAGAPIIYCDERLTIGVDEHNSILTGKEAPDLAAAMAQLAADPARRAAMSAASHSLSDSLTAAAMSRRYVDVYTRAIELFNRAN